MRLTVRVTGSQCLHLRRTSLHLLLLHLQLLRLALNLPLVVSTLLYQPLLLRPKICNEIPLRLREQIGNPAIHQGLQHRQLT